VLCDVVDLQRFRLMAAGDQFRVVYESLSKDPNSLANLDQVSSGWHWPALRQSWLTQLVGQAGGQRAAVHKGTQRLQAGRLLCASVWVLW